MIMVTGNSENNTQSDAVTISRNETYTDHRLVTHSLIITLTASASIAVSIMHLSGVCPNMHQPCSTIASVHQFSMWSASLLSEPCELNAPVFIQHC